MISSITSHGYQPLHSTPSNFISSTANVSDAEKDNETQSQSPAPTDSRKVRPTVDSQESQASKEDSTRQQTKKTAAESNSPAQLSEEELKEIQKLKQRDMEVRAHEAAHLAAAGQHAQGGAKFTLKKGPDGLSYAVGGSVSIDTSPEANPEATIRKADQIKRAALAPAEPSGQDRSVAAEASKMKLEAQAELAAEQRVESGPQSEAREVAATGQSNTAAESPAGTAKDEFVSLEPKSGVEQIKAATELLCEICSGDHPTAPHLEANQRKTGQYTAISQS